MSIDTEQLGERLDRAQQRLRERTEADGYLTVQEVAELARCEHKAVRRAITGGQLEAFCPVRKLLIREQDARAWIEARAVHSVPSAPRPRRERPAKPGSVASLREMERSRAAR